MSMTGVVSFGVLPHCPQRGTGGTVDNQSDGIVTLPPQLPHLPTTVLIPMMFSLFPADRRKTDQSPSGNVGFCTPF